MQGLIMEFLLPALGAALGMTIFSFGVFYFFERKSSERNESVHNLIKINNKELHKSVGKVDKTIEQGVVPKLDRLIDILDNGYVDLSSDNIKTILSQMEINGTELSDDGSYVFFGVVVNAKKYMFHVNVDTKDSNLSIEAYSREIKEVPSVVYENMLTILDKHKTGAISIEVVNQKKLIKVQDMIDCPKNKLHVETYKKTLGNTLNILEPINELLMENKNYSSPVKFSETLPE